MENKICPLLITIGDPTIDAACGKELCAWFVPTCDGGHCAIQILGAVEAAKQHV